MNSYGEDPMGGIGFSEKSIRLAFVRKVYGILFCQVAVTAAIVAWFTFDKALIHYVERHFYIYIISIVLLFVSLIVLSCCPDVRRDFPTNFIFLGIFTIVESFFLGCTASYYKTESVLLAMGICGILILALTLFAFQTKYDFTACGGFLFAILLIFTIVGILYSFWHNKSNLIISGIGAAIFCLYIIYDTQLMLGGNHKYALSPEEYIFAALNLYIDFVVLFGYLLSIVGGKN